MLTNTEIATLDHVQSTTVDTISSTLVTTGVVTLLVGVVLMVIACRIWHQVRLGKETRNSERFFLFSSTVGFAAFLTGFIIIPLGSTTTDRVQPVQEENQAVISEDY